MKGWTFQVFSDQYLERNQAVAANVLKIITRAREAVAYNFVGVLHKVILERKPGLWVAIGYNASGLPLDAIITKSESGQAERA